MLEVKKNGKNNFGYWVYGSLKYQGLIINDIFVINRDPGDIKLIKPNNVIIYRNKKGSLRFKIEI